MTATGALALLRASCPGSDVVRHWGSTAAERARPLPCDRHLPPPADALFRAVDVAAPPAVVFRWLCQLRVAPYSYDWIDNLGRQSPQTLTPGLEHLAVGQRLMTMFELVEFEPDRHLTAKLARPSPLFGDLAATYEVVPGPTPDRSRLVVKLVSRSPNTTLGTVARHLLPLGDLIMMRKQLLNLKHLAETSPS